MRNSDRRQGGSMLVKLVGAGIGLGVETYHHHKEKKRLQSSDPVAESSSSVQASSSRSARHREINRSKSASDIDITDEAPPAYLEVDTATAETLIEKGEAVPVDTPLDSPLETPRDYDEDDWALDEAADAADGTSEEKYKDGSKMDKVRVNVDETVRKFLVKHPEITRPPPSVGIEVPVILPQRRPGTKKRGFVRAYAPILEDVGITQGLFMDFLETFDECSKADPWIHGVMVAAGIAGFAPSVIAMVVSTAVQMAAKGAAEVQVRSRANFYLNQMNEKLFKPRGLYALVMGYDPDATQAVSFGQIDMATQSIAKYDLQSNEQSRWRRFGQDMRSRSGVTNAEEDMPVCAPLVFPSVDAAAGDAEKMGRMKRVGNFLDAYFDKQGQAKYNMEHPDTALGNAVPKPKFHSAYSDPSNPARSGDALALLTAGKLQVPRRRERRGGGGLIGAAIQGVGMIAEKRAMRGSETSNAPASYGGGGFSDNASIPYRGQSRYEQDDYFSDRRNRRRERSSQLDQLGLGGLGGGRGRGRGGGGGLKGIVKKKLKSGVLYLTIVNMPSEEELQMAREMLQAQSVAG